MLLLEIGDIISRDISKLKPVQRMLSYAKHYLSEYL